jgi:ribosomal protein S18 acetylase RimI-like enzyme
MPRARAIRDATATTLRLKPADPFELIRWLARSQSDPRKAVAELVQNSLDAQARNILVRRHRVRGAVCLTIGDDGQGVLPDLRRREALEYLATHVGHSRKMGLDPATRAAQVVAGQYGVGLLGFWSVGRFLEVRTRVGGSELLALRLEEDSPRARILQLPVPLDALATSTEVAVVAVHAAAQKALSGRRLADYLASELRGQLLRRDISLEVRDDIARGLAQKRFHVVPKRFAGERLELPADVPVEGHAPMRVELYLARGAERPAIQVACAGTVVADDVAQLEALGLSHPPWIGRELVGIVDFAAFRVPPGTRRGVMPDEAAAAFAEAMDRLAPQVEVELARLEHERTAAVDRDVVRELRRALRGFQRRLPRYELPEVPDRHGAHADGPLDEGEPGDASPPEGQSATEQEPSFPEPTNVPLFPVGPLASVAIAPAVVRVAPGAERRVRAVACDADGREVSGASFAWRVEDEADAGVAVTSDDDEARAIVRAPPDAPVGASVTLHVDAGLDDRTAHGSARVEITESARDRGALGIPEPHLVSDAEGNWRSRMVGERWEVNAEHEDYRALRADGRMRLRYLLALLAKEIVLRTTGRVETADVMESMVEVLAHAERNLRGT